MAASRNESTIKSRLFPVFHAEKPTIKIKTNIIAPPVVNSNGRFICDASRPAFRAKGGTTNIRISRTKTSDAPAEIAASLTSPVWCA